MLKPKDKKIVAVLISVFLVLSFFFFYDDVFNKTKFSVGRDKGIVDENNKVIKVYTDTPKHYLNFNFQADEVYIQRIVYGTKSVLNHTEEELKEKWENTWKHTSKNLNFEQFVAAKFLSKEEATETRIRNFKVYDFKQLPSHSKIILKKEGKTVGQYDLWITSKIPIINIYTAKKNGKYKTHPYSHRGNDSRGDPYWDNINRTRENVTIPDEPKVNAEFQVIANGQPARFHKAGIEVRGGTTQKKIKKSYGLSVKKKEAPFGISILGLPSERKWWLLGLQADLSLVATKTVWDFHATWPNRISPQSRYVELFINDEYKGVYLLAEKIDEEFLNLEEHDKIYQENNAALYSAFHHVRKYPDKNFTKEPISKMNFEDLTYENLEFCKEIQDAVDVQDLIDFQLFLNVIIGADGPSNNYYLAKHRNDKFFYVPGVFDTALRAKRANDWFANSLWELLRLCPGHIEQIQERWNFLKENHLHDFNDILDESLNEVESSYNFKMNEQTHRMHYNNIKKIWPERIDFMTKHMENGFIPEIKINEEPILGNVGNSSNYDKNFSKGVDYDRKIIKLNHGSGDKASWIYNFSNETEIIVVSRNSKIGSKDTHSLVYLNEMPIGVVEHKIGTYKESTIPISAKGKRIVSIRGEMDGTFENGHDDNVFIKEIRFE